MKSPEQANPWRQKADRKQMCGCQELGGGEGEWLVNGFVVPFWGDRRFWNWEVVMVVQPCDWAGYL